WCAVNSRQLSNVTAFVHFHHVFVAVYGDGVGVFSVAFRCRFKGIRVATVGQELRRNLREHGISEGVVDLVGGQLEAFFGRQLLNVGDHFIQFVFDQVSRTTGNGFFAIQNTGLQFSVHGSRSGTVFAFQDALSFFGDRLVTLTAQYVQYRLGTNNLRSRGYQRNPAQIFTHTRNLSQYSVELVGSTLLTQLVFHVGQHAARNLSHQNAAVGAFQGAFKLGVLLTHVAEVSSNFFDQQQIQTGITLGTGQSSNHRLSGSVAVRHGHRRNSGIHTVNTGFNGFQNGHVGQASGGVGVQLHFQVSLGFQTGYQFKRSIRSEYTSHIFNGDGIGTHIFDLFGQAYPGFQRVYRAGGVRQRGLRVFALFFNCF